MFGAWGIACLATAGNEGLGMGGAFRLLFVLLSRRSRCRYPSLKGIGSELQALNSDSKVPEVQSIP